MGRKRELSGEEWGITGGIDQRGRLDVAETDLAMRYVTFKIGVCPFGILRKHKE